MQQIRKEVQARIHGISIPDDKHSGGRALQRDSDDAHDSARVGLLVHGRQRGPL